MNPIADSANAATKPRGAATLPDGKTSRDGDSAETVGTDTVQRTIDQADLLWQNAVDTAESALAAASRTIQRNPTLAIAGVVAFGAVAALVIRHRQSQQQTSLHNLRRSAEKQARELRNVVRKELRSHDVGSTVGSWANSLGNIDLKPYLQPLLERAAGIAHSAEKSISTMAK